VFVAIVRLYLQAFSHVACHACNERPWYNQL
jgi:hypothetical protein